MTATDRRPPGHRDSRSTKEEQPYVEARQEAPHRPEAARHPRRSGWSPTSPSRARTPRPCGLQDTTELHHKLNEARDWVQLEGQDNWFFGGVLGAIGDFLNCGLRVLPGADQHPGAARGRCPRSAGSASSRSRPGSTSSFAGLRSTILVTLLDAALRRPRPVVGQHGHADHHRCSRWSFCIADRPAARHLDGAQQGRVRTWSRPVLDLMQTIPPFCYLAPMALFFGIGPAAAIVLTLIYALPPLVRITEHGIRSVSPTTIEAARSMGLTRGQMLRQVQLPMARAHHRRGHQPVHDGRAVDGHHRRPGQRARPRQAGRGRPPDPERRRRVGGRAWRSW